MKILNKKFIQKIVRQTSLMCIFIFLFSNNIVFAFENNLTDIIQNSQNQENTSGYISNEQNNNSNQSNENNSSNNDLNQSNENNSSNNDLNQSNENNSSNNDLNQSNENNSSDNDLNQSNENNSSNNDLNQSNENNSSDNDSNQSNENNSSDNDSNQLESEENQLETYNLNLNEAYIDFSQPETVSNGIELIKNNSSKIEKVHGYTCLNIQKSTFACFKVDKNFVSPDDNNLYFEITYYDADGYSLSLQYPSSNGTTYQRTSMPFNNSGEWRTTGIFISDAALDNLKEYSGGNFRIGLHTLIKSIKIKKASPNPETEPFGKRYGKGNFNDFTGKSCAGYQGWFSTSTIDKSWGHWGGTQGSAPKADASRVDVYPDIKDYDKSSLAQTAFDNLGSGENALLFDSKKKDVIDTQINWMKKYGIDGAGVQRFVNILKNRTVIVDSENDQLNLIKNAAEKNNRIFYMMYDISGGDESRYVDDIKFDWAYNIERGQQLLNSKSYATVDGKPVVCLWGLGVAGRPSDTDNYQKLIDFFKERGCYIIIGVSRFWRGNDPHNPNLNDPKYLDIYKQCDMISPWYVGNFSSQSGCDTIYKQYLEPDLEFCNEHNIKYYPCVFPGFSWALWQSGKPNAISREAGQFFWHQAYNLKKLGVNSFYIAMFDEYDEGTAIMKNASDYFDIPKNQYFVTASADGYWLSSDYQLRVAGAAIKMVKGETPAYENVPVEHSTGPIYYRNSFESKYVKCNEDTYSGIYPVDPCFKNPQKVRSDNIIDDNTEIIKTNQAKTGDYVVSATGKSTSNNSSYLFKISDTKINVNTDMVVKYDYMPLDELGKNIKIILQFDDGSYLDEENLEQENEINIGQWNNISYPIRNDKYTGKKIIAVLVQYNGIQPGDFNAYIDNIIIEESTLPKPSQPTQPTQPSQPTQPTEPIRPTQPTKPANSSSKSKSSKHSKRETEINTSEVKTKEIFDSIKLNELQSVINLNSSQTKTDFKLSFPDNVALINDFTNDSLKSLSNNIVPVTVIYESDNPNVASIDHSGIITANGPGQTIIRATVRMQNGYFNVYKKQIIVTSSLNSLVQNIYLQPEISGWKNVNYKWYHLSQFGIPDTGWKNIDNKWYYFSDDGTMNTGWISYNGKNYLLYSNGEMAKNTTVYGYRFDNNGVAFKL